jgi:cytochrome c oxidase subunit 1
MRAQLFGPDTHIVSDQQYNELFTMHGTIMLLLFATPLFVGFANEIMPLQIGSPDVAFPRLNLFSYYAFLFGGLILLASFVAPGGAAAFGWYAYSPLTSAVNAPGIGGDMWIMGLTLSGFGTILSGVNFVTTIVCMRAPGMTMFRMPIFTWNILVTSMMVLLRSRCWPRRCWCWRSTASSARRCSARQRRRGHVAAPVLVLRPSRGLHRGDPVLRHRHRGRAVFSRKPLFGYKGMVAATIGDRRAVDDRVGAPHVHHRRGAAAVLLAHDVPHRGADRGEVLQLGRHDVARASSPSRRRCCSSSGFLVTFLFGGLTGVILASPPLDFQVTDSYFVVAHFHYVLFGTVVFSMFAGFYFWWPKFTGKKLDNTLGAWHFWTLFIGFHMTFLVQHWLGVEGMPRRIANYPFLPPDVTTLNQISSIGSWILGASTLFFIYNVYKTSRYGERVTADDPWGYANSLEWATSCPPPRHNFTSIPRIRSERPAFDLHYPQIKSGRPGRKSVSAPQ